MALSGLPHRVVESFGSATQNWEWLRNQPVVTTAPFEDAVGPVGTVVGKVEIFDAKGNSLGFLPVYDAIT